MGYDSIKDKQCNVIRCMHVYDLCIYLYTMCFKTLPHHCTLLKSIYAEQHKIANILLFLFIVDNCFIHNSVL